MKETFLLTKGKDLCGKWVELNSRCNWWSSSI